MKRRTANRANWPQMLRCGAMVLSTSAPAFTRRRGGGLGLA